MIAKSGKKWIVTIITASILMVIALIGGRWGTSYAKSSAVTATPVITSIDPIQMVVSNADTLLVIRGSNLGAMDVTRVRFYQWGGDVYELVPLFVHPNMIVVKIPGDMTGSPCKYDVMVMVYESTPTMPTLPPTPGEGSARITLSIYNPTYFYLPLINKR